MPEPVLSRRLVTLYFPESLPHDLMEELRCPGEDESGQAVPFLRGWRAIETALSSKGRSLTVRLVSDAGGDVTIRFNAKAVPRAYARPMPGEEDLDQPWLAVNLGMVVKETIETTKPNARGHVTLRL